MASDNSKIGVTTATIVGMNAMIGSGIFTAPAAMASYVGPAGILAYLFVVVSVWCIGLSLARVAQLFPEEGSFYVYTKQWGGHTLGMLASFSYFAGLLIAMGLLSQIAGVYLQPLLPHYSAYTLGLCILALLTFLNMFGVVLSEIGQLFLIVCTLFPLLATTLLCFTKAQLTLLTPFAPYGFSNIFKATRIVIFSFFGFECATSLFNIVEQPEKNVPRALTYSIILVGALYILFVSSLIISTPLALFTSPTMPLSATLHFLFPNNTWLISIIHGAILSAIIGTVHSMIWSSSNLLLILLKKTRSPFINRLNAAGQLTTQKTAAFVGITIAISYATLNNIELFFNLTALFILFAFICSMITLLTIKQEWVNKKNYLTIVGISTALLMVYFALEGLFHQLML